MDPLQLVRNMDVVRVRSLFAIFEEFLIHLVELLNSLVICHLQQSWQTLPRLVSYEPLFNPHQLQTLVPLGGNHNLGVELSS